MEIRVGLGGPILVSADPTQCYAVTSHHSIAVKPDVHALQHGRRRVHLRVGREVSSARL